MNSELNTNSGTTQIFGNGTTSPADELQRAASEVARAAFEAFLLGEESMATVTISAADAGRLARMIRDLPPDSE